MALPGPADVMVEAKGKELAALPLSKKGLAEGGG
jgi:hypothetical protein